MTASIGVSPPRDLVIVGGGEHCRVIVEAARSYPTPQRIRGFLDSHPCRETANRYGIAWLGPDKEIANHPDAAFVLGMGSVGNTSARRRFVREHQDVAHSWETIIHPTAWVSPTAEIGPGTVILTGAIVNGGARIGRHCIINTRACIEHDATIDDFVQAGPGSIVGAAAIVGEESHLGMGSLIRDHRRIGSRCIVGMGAVVVGNFDDDTLLLGIPAKPSPT